MPDYDAFVLVSFGGPEGPADVMPFLENVTRGRGVPPGAARRGGSPLRPCSAGSARSTSSAATCSPRSARTSPPAGLDLPLYWGNRNWHPFLADTVAQMAADGVRHAIAFVTSAYGSYSSCRQYLDDIEAARAQAGPAHRASTRSAISSTTRVSSAPSPRPPARRSRRSRPSLGMMRGLSSRRTACPRRWQRPAGQHGGLYPAQLAEAARLVAVQLAAEEAASAPGGWPTRAAAGRRRCPGWAPTSATSSRTWPPAAPRPWSWSRWASSPTTWRCCTTWISRRRGRAERLGLPMARAATPGTDPRFVSMITELVLSAASQPARCQRSAACRRALIFARTIAAVPAGRPRRGRPGGGP